MQAQADALVLEVVKALDGDAEAELVQSLLELRQTLEGQNSGEERSAEVDAAQTQVVNLINTFYRDRLEVRPTIKEYIDQDAGRAGRLEVGADGADHGVLIVDDEHQVPAVEGRARMRDAEADEIARYDVDVALEPQEGVLVAEGVDAGGVLQVEAVLPACALERDGEARVEREVAASGIEEREPRLWARDHPRPDVERGAERGCVANPGRARGSLGVDAVVVHEVAAAAEDETRALIVRLRGEDRDDAIEEVTSAGRDHRLRDLEPTGEGGEQRAELGEECIDPRHGLGSAGRADRALEEGDAGQPQARGRR